MSTTGWWILGYALAGAVVLLAATLLIVIILLARRIVTQAAEITRGLDGSMRNTDPLFDLANMNHALGSITRGLVHLLLNRVLRPLREIKRYGDEILAAGLAIAGNLDGADEALRTRDLARELPGLVRSTFGEREVEWSA